MLRPVGGVPVAVDGVTLGLPGGVMRGGTDSGGEPVTGMMGWFGSDGRPRFRRVTTGRGLTLVVTGLRLVRTATRLSRADGPTRSSTMTRPPAER